MSPWQRVRAGPGVSGPGQMFSSCGGSGERIPARGDGRSRPGGGWFEHCGVNVGALWP